jgi:hypothetical protein
MAISEVDKQIDQTMDFIKNVLSGLTVFFLTGGYFLVKDKFSIVFVLISFVLSFLLNKVYNKLSFQIRMRRYPPERKREYVKRVYYLKDYAKEIRLDPEVTDVLEERFVAANQEVYEAEKSLAKKKSVNSANTCSSFSTRLPPWQAHSTVPASMVSVPPMNGSSENISKIKRTTLASTRACPFIPNTEYSLTSILMKFSESPHTGNLKR